MRGHRHSTPRPQTRIKPILIQVDCVACGRSPIFASLTVMQGWTAGHSIHCGVQAMTVTVL